MKIHVIMIAQHCSLVNSDHNDIYVVLFCHATVIVSIISCLFIIESSTDMDDAQRTNPNMSARARRRERSMRNDTPRSSYEHINLEPRRKGSANSDRAGSAKSDRSNPDSVDSNRKPSYQTPERRTQSSSTPEAPGNTKPIKMRQASIVDDEDDDESFSQEADEERDRKREEKEQANLEKVLDATLHIAADIDEDTIEVEEAQQPDLHHVQSEPALGQPPMFSKETLNNSGRLMGRIVALRKDCLHGVGLPKLHKAYQILDNVDSESIEAQLVELLGQELFDEYAGKIWQLKFCEESAFRIN